MKYLSIIFTVAIGLGAYALTLYLNTQTPAPAIEAPVATEMQSAAPLPAFSFTAINGETYNTEDFKGKILIINFWASWCSPCVKEFPDLLRLATKDNIILIALSSDYDKSDMQHFLDRLRSEGHNLNLPNILIAMDENSRITHDLFETYKLPETLIVGRDGKLKKKLVGANWDVQAVKNFIAKL